MSRVQIPSTAYIYKNLDGFTFFTLSLIIAPATLITILSLPDLYKYLTKFKKTEATILAIEKINKKNSKQGGYYYLYDLQVEFSTGYNQVRTKVTYSSYEKPEIGQKIEIRYNPQNHYQAVSFTDKEIKTSISILIFAWVFTIFGVIYTQIGFNWLIFGLTFLILFGIVLYNYTLK